MALGIGLTITNTNAVIEALFGIKSAFKRTPKYRVQKKGEKIAGRRSIASASASSPGSSSLIGCYFALTIWYAITNENYFTVPFLLLFVVGYWYTGLLWLLQGRFERKGDAGQEMHEKPYPVGI